MVFLLLLSFEVKHSFSENLKGKYTEGEEWGHYKCIYEIRYHPVVPREMMAKRKGNS